MKLFVKLILIISLVTYCKNSEPENLMMDPAFLLMLYENSIYKNYCPSKNATLDSGTYTITLNTGEEYWFDVASKSYRTYAIGIAKSSSDQAFTFFNGACSYNFTITNQRKTFTADQEKKVWYSDNEFVYFDFIFIPGRENYFGAIKMASGRGNIVLKIP
ncbi:MAG: hypothetical protein H7A23_20760 [Leptospiraceae bacterium]|nr:hypothetical protein [Leptospiraceae bacterium]